MTITQERRTVAQTIDAFIDATNRHDVVDMVDLCALDADFHYVPFEMWGKQRVVRGDGKVRTIGRPLWNGRAEAFTDLTYVVDRLTDDNRGNVAVEATVTGTQAAPWGVIAPRGGSYTGSHLLVFAIDQLGLITSIREYWDGAALYRQLGHLEVD